MTAADDHEQVASLLGAYALDALDPDEGQVVRDHLAWCPRCRAEVEAHREIAAALGNVVEPPPPGLWHRIAEQVDSPPRSAARAVPMLLAGGPPGGDGAGGPPPPGASPLGTVAGDRSVHPSWAARAARWGPVLLGAAAVVAVMVLAVGLVRVDHQLGTTRAALSARGDAAAVAAALAAPGHQTVKLLSPGGAQLAEFVVAPGGRGYLVSSAMPALPQDETYQLWGMIQGRPISLGLLGSHPANGSFTVGAATPSALAVTVEPAGGVTTPDRSPVASGTYLYA